MNARTPNSLLSQKPCSWQQRLKETAQILDYLCKHSVNVTPKSVPQNQSGGPILAEKLVPRTNFGYQNLSAWIDFGSQKWSPGKTESLYPAQAHACILIIHIHSYVASYISLQNSMQNYTIRKFICQ